MRIENDPAAPVAQPSEQLPSSISSLTPADNSAAVTPRVGVTMVFQGAPMHFLWSMIHAAAFRDTAVLLRGEAGTGKELAARQVHAAGPRAGGPFIVVDCSAMQDELVGVELFGRVATTAKGETNQTLGALRAAEGGTVYLDEVGDLPRAIQTQLLTTLREARVTPVGGGVAEPINVRVMAGTHRALEAMAARGTFDPALLAWLNASRLDVPALRDRAEDVVPLAEYCIARIAQRFNEPAKSLSAAAAKALVKFTWPYNVRELFNVIEHAHAAAPDGEIDVIHLPLKVKAGFVKRQQAREATVIPLDLLERNQIVQALRAADGNQSKAARLLRIQRQRLYRRVQHFGLEALTTSGGSRREGWHGVAEAV